MHTTLRRALFILFFIAFFVVGTLLIIKTQGLVFDWENIKLLKTGGIYIRAVPSDAKILIDGKPYKKPISLFNKGTLIKDLFPRDYTVLVERDGRTAWKKTLTVESGLVVAVSNIRLFEENPKIVPASARTVDDFWVTREGIVESANGKLFFKEVEIKGMRVKESADNLSAIITEDIKGNLFFIDLVKPTNTVNARELFTSLSKKIGVAKKAERILLHPFSANSFLVEAKGGIFLIDTRKLTAELVLQSTSTLPALFVESANEIIAIRDTRAEGYNFLLNSSFSFSLPSPSEKVFGNRAGTFFFLVNKEGILLFFDRAKTSSTIVAEGVSQVIFSPDETKALIIGKNSKFSLYFLKEDTGDVKIPEGTFKTLPLATGYRNQNPEVGWFPDFANYLWILNGTELNISEVDTRIPAVATTLFENAKKISFFEKKLYLLNTEGELTEIEFSF